MISTKISIRSKINTLSFQIILPSIEEQSSRGKVNNSQGHDQVKASNKLDEVCNLYENRSFENSDVLTFKRERNRKWIDGMKDKYLNTYFSTNIYAFKAAFNSCGSKVINWVRESTKNGNFWEYYLHFPGFSQIPLRKLRSLYKQQTERDKVKKFFVKNLLRITIQKKFGR